MFGFLNVYKPEGITSHDVIGVLRRVTKIRQIGHTGTLDPFAVGVLPVCIGKATRLIEYLDDDKAYIGRFSFGKNTDTYDKDGKITETFDIKVDETQVIKHLKSFMGEIEQVPPIYSAIKVDGKKLYDYARAGKEVDIKPRKVTIEKIELKKFSYEEQYADIYIKCSKGTYIRSIAYDLGKSLGCGGYLSKLERVQAGKFFVENAVKLEDLKSVEDVKNNLIEVLDYLPQTKQELNEVEYKRISHGMPVYNRVGIDEGIVLLTKDNRLIAISEVYQEGLKAKKVFIS